LGGSENPDLKKKAKKTKGEKKKNFGVSMDSKGGIILGEACCRCLWVKRTESGGEKNAGPGWVSVRKS